MTGYGQFCSMARAHEVLGGRWTLLVVREILSGSRSFNEIRRGIPRVSRTVLSERLQALVFAGAIARADGPHGPESAALATSTRSRRSDRRKRSAFRPDQDMIDLARTDNAQTQPAGESDGRSGSMAAVRRLLRELQLQHRMPLSGVERRTSDVTTDRG